MPGLVSPELVEQFNRASGLAREGKFEEALAAWNLLLGPKEETDYDAPKLVMTGEFLGVAMMRKAWALMDLGRYEEARGVLEDDVMQACLGQFDLETLYEYYFSLGNTLGELGDIDTMDDAFTRALGIAAEELGDIKRCTNAWCNLMEYGARAKAWKYVERESGNAQAFAENTDSEMIRFRAGWFHLVALKELGRSREAREEAEAMQADYLRKGLPVMVAKLQDFMNSL